MYLQTGEFKFYDFFLSLIEIILYINFEDFKKSNISTNKYKKVLISIK